VVTRVELLEAIFATMPGAVIVVGETGAIEVANRAALQMLGYSEAQLIGTPIARIVRTVGTTQRAEAIWCAHDGERIPVLHSSAPLGERRTVYAAIDLRGRKQLEHELRKAHKLESVGRLAAGVAHEINTPLQYVSDSIHFLRDAMHDLASVVERAPGSDEVDVAYLLANMPRAFQRSFDGLGRVTAIVRSMKELSDTSSEMTLVDLNAAITTTLTLAVPEYKYVAEVVTELGELPLVTCVGSDVQQAILNIVINAAHAIAEVVRGSDTKGRITVRTSLDGAYAVIAIRDTGCGIPENIRGSIFDPFFTTKDIGRGTGQGLSVAWATIVDRHAGEIAVASEVGVGSTFTIRLPIATGSFASTWSLLDARNV
jgi:two-component system, NtrC family, sensor kinase